MVEDRPSAGIAAVLALVCALASPLSLFASRAVHMLTSQAPGDDRFFYFTMAAPVLPVVGLVLALIGRRQGGVARLALWLNLLLIVLYVVMLAFFGATYQGR